MRLLLVEDDGRIAQPTARALRDAGHQVQIAANGVDGLAHARSGEFDAALPDRVEGLDLGGDAYLPKPYELPELLALLRAVVRRGERVRSARVPFADGAGLLDVGRREVCWHGETVGLTAREYALLETLVLSRGRWFTRQELLSKVWGPDFSGEARVVDVYVSYLRRKLSPEALLSSRGLGYQLP